MAVLHRVGREYIWQVAAFLVVILDRLLIPGLLLRGLGVDGFAGWMIAVTFASLLTIFDLGSTRHFSTRMLALHAQGQQVQAIQAYRAGTALIAALTCVGGLLLVLWATLVPLQSGDAETNRTLLPLVVPIVLALVLQLMTGLRQSLYRAHQQFARETVIRTSADVVRVVAIATAAAMGASLVTLGWVWLVAVAVALLLPLFIDTRRRFPAFVLGRFAIDREQFSALIRIAPGYWLAAMAATLFAAAPILALGYFASAAAVVAQFALMRTIANLVRQVLQMFANVFGLELARRFAVGDSAGFAIVFSQSNRFLGVQAAVVAAILLVLGRDLFGLWTNQVALFDAGVLMLAILPPVLLPGMMLSTEALAYAERPWVLVRIRLIQLAISVAAYFTLAIADVALRMMAALAIGEVVGFGVPLMFAMRSLDRELLLRRQLQTVGYATAALIGASVIMAPLWLWPAQDIAVRLMTGAALGAVAFVLIVAALGVDGTRRSQLIAGTTSWLSNRL